jgi:hypothetical protein
MPALGGFPRGVGCQGLVVSAPALVPHRLAKGAVGSLKGRVPLLPLANPHGAVALALWLSRVRLCAVVELLLRANPHGAAAASAHRQGMLLWFVAGCRRWGRGRGISNERFRLEREDTLSALRI